MKSPGNVDPTSLKRVDAVGLLYPTVPGPWTDRSSPGPVDKVWSRAILPNGLRGVSSGLGGHIRWKKLDWVSEETAFSSRPTELPSSLSSDAYTMYDVRYFNQKVNAWKGTTSTASSAVPYKREGRGDEGN